MSGGMEKSIWGRKGRAAVTNLLATGKEPGARHNEKLKGKKSKLCEKTPSTETKKSHEVLLLRGLAGGRGEGIDKT